METSKKGHYIWNLRSYYSLLEGIVNDILRELLELINPNIYIV